MRQLFMLLGGASLFCTPLAHSVKLMDSCRLVSGKLLQKTNAPLFKFQRNHQSLFNTYPLTHTRFFIQDGNGNIYRVNLDNLYYTNLTNAQAVSNRDVGIIADLSRRYPAGSNVEVCGKIYRRGHNWEIRSAHPRGCEGNLFNGFLHFAGNDISANLRYTKCL